MKKLWIFDIDGVLLCSAHRVRFNEQGRLDLTHWRENSTYDNVMKDKPLALAEFAKHLIDQGEQVAILTARVLGKADYKILEKTIGSIPSNFILSRDGDEDNRKDWQLKTQKVRPFLNSLGYDDLTKRNKFVTFFDDNQSNVTALANMGIRSIWVPYMQDPSSIKNPVIMR